MRAVVTGAAGFIGSHLTEALLARGDEVIAIERPGAPPGWLDGYPVTFAPTGIHDERRLARLFDGAGVVFHLAALTEACTPAECYHVNTEGTACVMRAAAALGASAPQVVFMSSLAAAGPCRDGSLLDADTVPRPLSHYGRSKLHAEVVVHAYGDRVATAILRFPAVYGPRDVMVLKLLKMIDRGFALGIGRWEREFSLIYAADAVAALLAAATLAAAGRTWCPAHPEPVTWGDFVAAAAAALRQRPLRIALPAAAARAVALAAEGCARLGGRAARLNRDRVRELTQPRWVCDPRPTMTQLGFRPAWPLARGLGATASWLKEARWL